MGGNVKNEIPGSDVFRYDECKILMATKAIHVMGDISRKDPDYCVVYGETETDYVGNWVTGYGFIDVKFSKETTRECTPEEKKWLDDNQHRLRIM